MGTFMQKYEQFKKTFISANVPNEVLLELIESYMQSDNDETKAEPAPVFEG